jgi:Tfp pilus assembly protein PilV
MGWIIMDCSVRDSGFSLLEIFISILIVAVTAIVIAFFSKTSSLTSSFSKGSETAYMIAELKLSDLSADPAPANGNDTYTIDGKEYRRIWNITETGNVVRAEITVKWQAINGEKQITLLGAVN